MSGRTLYQVLMLDPSADGSIIALVYRALAKRHHPDHDHTGGAAARMAELNDAYATLSDPVKRVSYDRSLKPGSDRVAVQRDRDRQDAGAWAVAVPVAHPLPDQRGGGEAGPPPAYPPPSGRIMTYGRYRGWSISQVAHHDRDYLEWLQRTPSGRAYREDLAAVLSGPT